jgi:hypothetical protein
MMRIMIRDDDRVMMRIRTAGYLLQLASRMLFPESATWRLEDRILLS